MTDSFEARLSRDLRAYADKLVGPPVEAMAVAERTISTRPMAGRPWWTLAARPAWRAVAIAALILALLASAAFIGSRLITQRPLVPPSQLSFRPAGETTWAASDVVAAGLRDGRVLVIHGPGAQIYDPVRNTYTHTGPAVGLPDSLQHARTATTLRDGRVLLTAGDGSAWTYEPASGSFLEASRMLLARSFGYSATRLPDGRVLFVGGVGPPPDPGGSYGATIAAAELFDPRVSEFVLTGSLREDRVGHAAVLLLDGRVLIAGGSYQRPTGLDSFSSRRLDSAEAFDPASDSFLLAGSMSRNRDGLTLTRLLDGRVLVAGGRGDMGGGHHIWTATEIFDPTTGYWAKAGDMVGWRLDASAVLLGDGRVLLVGGQIPSGGGPAPYSETGSQVGPGTTNPIDGFDVEVYDATTESWQLAGRETVQRDPYPSLVLLSSGLVYVTGGVSADGGVTESVDELFGPRP